MSRFKKPKLPKNLDVSLPDTPAPRISQTGAPRSTMPPGSSGPRASSVPPAPRGTMVPPAPGSPPAPYPAGPIGPAQVPQASVGMDAQATLRRLDAAAEGKPLSPLQAKSTPATPAAPPPPAEDMFSVAAQSAAKPATTGTIDTAAELAKMTPNAAPAAAAAAQEPGWIRKGVGGALGAAKWGTIGTFGVGVPLLGGAALMAASNMRPSDAPHQYGMGYPTPWAQSQQM